MNLVTIELTVASQRSCSLSLSFIRCHPMITGSGGRDCNPGPENSTLRNFVLPGPIITKLGTVDYVGDPYAYANFS